MKQLKTKILKNERLAPRFCRMAVESPYLAKASKPGQFVEVKCSDFSEPILRRPLGVHRIRKSGIEILYEIVGAGTEMLSRKKAGEALDVIGPLGNGFVIGGVKDKKFILVAGGAGVAPLYALAEALVRRFAGSPVRRLMILIGARTKLHVLCEKEFKRLGAEVMVATEDGSKGHKGLVTDLLKDLLVGGNLQQAAIYACGPSGMLKAVAGVAKSCGISCQVSMEERMACGVGVCLGCPVKVRKLKHTNTRTHESANYEYKMVCKDGPVFNAEEIAW